MTDSLPAPTITSAFEPTALLRFKKSRQLISDGVFNSVEAVNVLQQLWVDKALGEQEWRDVPVVE